ncbi:MAG: HAD hydrolase family protein [Phycisphaerales bacterium]
MSPNPPSTPQSPRPRAPYDAICCDVDGGLSPDFFGPADTATLAAVAEHNRRAHEDRDRPPLTLCTGRPLPFADAMARIVAVRDLPILCEGGVWMLDPATYRWSRDPNITEDHLEFARELGRWATDTFDGCYLETGKTAAVTIFHDRGPDHLRAHVVPAVEAEVARRNAPYRVAMTWTCINVEPLAVSKATGLDRAIAHANLDPKRLAGIGDTMSDLPIRERVAFFACPANAAADLKPHADYVSPYEEARGVVDILERMKSAD